MRFPFVGPSYTYRSLNFDAQRALNQYPIKSEQPDSKAMSALVGTPGKSLFSTLGLSRCRGARKAQGRVFFVYGAGFFEVFSDGTNNQIGTLLTDVGFVSMSDNGFQVIMVDGNNGYLFVMANNNNTVTDGGFDDATAWTAGSGWVVAASKATATGAISTAISTTPSPLIVTAGYTLTYTITRSAGSVTASLGGTVGITRSAAGTYTETIVPGSSDTLLTFTGAGFTGTIDSVSITTQDTFFQITDPYFLGANTVTFIDSYFLFNKPKTQQYYLSAQFDGSTGNALDFASKEALPDNIVGVMAVHQLAWLFGEESTEIVYDTGANDFPFSPVQNSLIAYGCAAAGSIASSANTVFWLGNDKDGNATVWMANGYQPQRISTSTVEFAIGEYATISDATAYTYQEDGRYFYVLNFTSANATWAYDVALGQWHERAFYNSMTGFYERDKAEFHIFAFGKHLVGDYNSNLVYQQSLDIYTDNGSPIRRLRAAPHFADSDTLDYIYYSNFQLDMQTGIGSATGDIEATDPQVILQWSNDGGYTWSSEHARSAGKIGRYKKRARWNQLGRSRDRVFRVIFDAPCKYFVVQAKVDINEGTN